MTKYPELKITVNNEQVTWEETNRWAVKRAIHVLQQISDLGSELFLGNQVLDKNQIHTLSNNEILQACTDTKMKLGKQGILDLYAPILQDTDTMWHNIKAKSQGNYKEAHTLVEAKGVNPKEIVNLIRADDNQDFMALAYQLHPEHYLGGINTDKSQEVMETIGAYKEPTHFTLKIIVNPTDEATATPDPNATMVMLGKIFLASDHFDTGAYAMHQFYVTDSGLKINLGLYMPSATPDELVFDHNEHFAIEFGNAMKLILDNVH